MTTIRYTDKPHHYNLIMFLHKIGINFNMVLVYDKPLHFRWNADVNK